MMAEFYYFILGSTFYSHVLHCASHLWSHLEDARGRADLCSCTCRHDNTLQETNFRRRFCWRTRPPSLQADLNSRA